MTLSKLSLRNARRQAGDYLVYFATVIMVTVLMYSLNGLIFSEEIQSLSKLLKSLPLMIVMASIAVVCIMSWLVSYTAKFILTRRSRELGTYILIGLENWQVARLFFLENIMVGGFAFLFGILLGNIIFQFLRAVVLALFGIPYHFAFSFSLRTVGLTLLYFLFIYLFAQLRSRKRIRTMKIYDLIYFERQNENAVIEKSNRRKKISAVSIVLGVIGTVMIMAGGMIFAILGAVCIIFFLYGFFASFSSGIPAWFEKHGARKYQGQNLLVFRTLCAKMATMGVIMATISLLFTATLISEGSGITIYAMLRNRTAMLSCFDIIFSSTDPEAEGFAGCTGYVNANIPTESSREYNIYLGETSELTEYVENCVEYYRCYPKDVIMRASDYAALREMLGYPAVALEQGQYLIHCQPYLEKALKGWSEPVTAGRHTLTLSGICTENFAQYLWNVNGQGFCLVVPDEAVQNCPVSHRMYVARTKEPVSEEQYDILEDELWHSDTFMRDFDLFMFIKSDQEAEMASMMVMVVFPLYYLALVLTMAAATILTLRQLSERNRYRQQFLLLYKLGMEQREMVKALKTQFTIYYTMPAIPSVLIGVSFILNLGNQVEPGVLTGASHPLVLAGITLGLFFLIYAVYILLSYTSMKKCVTAFD